MKKRYTTVAGRTILTRYSASSSKRKGTRRAPRQNKTPEAVAKVNLLNRIRELTIKLNSNFVPGDLWITLTYENTKDFGLGLTREDCMKAYKAFRKKIQRKARKLGIEPKMIDSYGCGKLYGRPHHHVCVSDVPTELLIESWPHGNVHIEIMYGYNYQRIAKYMLKNAEQSEDGKIRRSYSCTRNIVTPETKVETMKSEGLQDPEDIKPLDGYYVDRDSINVYEHPIFETNCMEYIQVSLKADPRLTRWSRGRVAAMERQYKIDMPKQIEMELQK